MPAGDGDGYVEDGREIFDDDDDVDEVDDKRKKGGKKAESKKRLRDVNKSVEGKGSIRKLFGNAVPKKKKEANVKLEEDDILADILGEIHPDGSKSTSDGTAKNGGASSSTATYTRLTEKSEMAKVKEYMQSFSKNIPKKPAIKDDTADDDVSNFLPITIMV